MSVLASVVVGAERARGAGMDGYRLLAERGLEYKIVRAQGAADAAMKARSLRAAGWTVSVERAS